MRQMRPPFQFDLKDLLQRGSQKLKRRVGTITINLPFISFAVTPDDTEKRVAREIVIRLADRRVLTAFACCDDGIEKARASLQEIRRLLVDKQVELGDHTDGALYFLVEIMVESIRQFFTFEEHLGNAREQYFAALEILRAHLHRCLIQVSAISQTEIPKIPENMRYDGNWQIEAYVPLELSE